MAEDLPTKEELERWFGENVGPDGLHLSPADTTRLACAVVLLARDYERVCDNNGWKPWRREWEASRRAEKWASVKLPGEDDD